MSLFGEVGNEVMDQSEEKKKNTKPEWYKRTERLLRRHKNMPVEIENLELRIEMDQEAGPRISSQIKQIITGPTNAVSDPIQQWEISMEAKRETLRRKQRLLKILDNTVQAFTKEEYDLYHLRYSLELHDFKVSRTLGLSRSPYFDKQRRVVMKAARLMCIEIPEDEQPEEWKGWLFDEVDLPEAAGLNQD